MFSLKSDAWKDKNNWVSSAIRAISVLSLYGTVHGTVQVTIEIIIIIIIIIFIIIIILIALGSIDPEG